MSHRPHHVEPHHDKVRLLLAYKNFQAKAGISHIGLGVSLQNTAAVLRKHHVWAELLPIVKPSDVYGHLCGHKGGSKQHHEAPFSHVVFSAPWVQPEEFLRLTHHFPDTTFISLCHSNVGFLQFDARGVQHLRGYLNLEKAAHNFRVAGNNKRFCEWLRNTYRAPCAYLPNLYNLQRHHPYQRPPWDGSLLKIGCFGAVRPQKNLMCAVGAALEVAVRVHADTEIHVSDGRPENSHVIIRALHEMVDGIRGVRLINNHWESWPEFLQTVHAMDLLMQPSYSETFNVVCADGISQGVPCVVGEAIEWAPKSWRAETDDASEIARKGVHLLKDCHAAAEGWEALEHYLKRGLEHWKEFLHQS